MENLDIALSEIFNAVLERRQNEGAFTREEYLDLVDQVLEEKREIGEIDDDFDVEQAKENLAARWNEVAESDTAASEGVTLTDGENP